MAKLSLALFVCLFLSTSCGSEKKKKRSGATPETVEELTEPTQPETAEEKKKRELEEKKEQGFKPCTTTNQPGLEPCFDGETNQGSKKGPATKEGGKTPITKNPVGKTPVITPTPNPTPSPTPRYPAEPLPPVRPSDPPPVLYPIPTQYFGMLSQSQINHCGEHKLSGSAKILCYDNTWDLSPGDYARWHHQNYAAGICHIYKGTPYFDLCSNDCLYVVKKRQGSFPASMCHR